MKDQEFYHIIEKQLIGDISSEERSRLEAWLSHSSENRQLFDNMELYWELTGKMKPDITIDTKSALDQLVKKANNKPGKMKYLQFYKWAATIALIAIVGYILYDFQSAKPKYIEFASGDNSSEVLLADGSTITLNKNSTVKYPESFSGKERKIYLIGEAFFEVERSEEMPFIVKLEKTEVKVLGTSFNINANPIKSTTEVVVATGKVAFYKINDPSNSLTLNAGDHAVFNKQRNLISREDSDNLNYLSWKTNELVFDDTSLEQVFSTLEDYFNIKFRVDNSNITNCTFTGKFSNPNLEEVLEVIGLSLNLNFKNNQNTFEVAGEGCVND